MSDIVVQFDSPVTDEGGRAYSARVCGAPDGDGLWEGWIEFDPEDGGPTLRTRRETKQPNRMDLEYWGTGLTMAYLEGALERARDAGSPPPRSRS